MTTNTMTATNTTVSSTTTVSTAVQNPDFFINDASESLQGRRVSGTR